MSLRIPSHQNTSNEQGSSAAHEPTGRASGRREKTSDDFSEGSPHQDKDENRAPAFFAAGLRPPGAGAPAQSIAAPSATVSLLPSELKGIVAAELSWEDALHLRQASSEFLRLSNDPRVLREQYKKAGLALPAEGLSTTEARDAAWEGLGRLLQLRRQYAVGPTSVKILNFRAANMGQISSSAFSPDGRFVVTGAMNRFVGLWDLEQDPLQATVLEGYADKVGFSPDGRFIATTSIDDTARLWDRNYNPPRAIVLDEETESSSAASFSPNGRFVVLSSGNRAARFWDLGQNPPRAIVLGMFSGPVRFATFSPDGRLVLTLSYHGRLSLWNLEEESPRSIALPGDTGRFGSAIFSPDGRFILATEAHFGPNGHLWDLRQNNPQVVVLRGHTDWICSAAFSPDGRFGLTGSLDGTARLWNLEHDPPQAIVMSGHRGGVTSVTFCPSGPFALTGSILGTVRLWNLEPDLPKSVVLEERATEIVSATFSPDGRFVRTVSNDGSGRFFDFAPKSTLQTSTFDHIAASGAHLWRFLLPRWMRKENVDA